ncbi:DUF4358 domain-containing protein [Turicibacter sp. TJ11]|uniref:DUF4358 domain-containing protein n=1 Tax=Turicibacter sp. TJ11 TaxID=2806443 RepID=UPI001F2CE961|nr:DUF4358 domain-containing protein [Turicibacter sp. TJ11]
MKKIKLIMMAVLVTVLAVGCSKGAENNTSTSEVSPEVIITKIQELLSTSYDIPLQDGALPGYNVIDMTDPEQMLMYEGTFNTEDIESGYILQPMMNVKSELVMVAKAKDATALENIKAGYEKVLSDQDAMWSQYLPDQYEFVKGNVIKTQGNYALYVTSEKAEEIVKLFEEQVK